MLFICSSKLVFNGHCCPIALRRDGGAGNSWRTYKQTRSLMGSQTQSHSLIYMHLDIDCVI